MATATARATAATTRFIRALLGNGVYGGNGFTRSNGATEPNGGILLRRVPRFARRWLERQPESQARTPEKGLVIPRVARSMGPADRPAPPAPLRSPPLLRSSA